VRHIPVPATLTFILSKSLIDSFPNTITLFGDSHVILSTNLEWKIYRLGKNESTTIHVGSVELPLAHKPLPRYPFPFFRAFDLDHGNRSEAISGEMSLFHPNPRADTILSFELSQRTGCLALNIPTSGLSRLINFIETLYCARTREHGRADRIKADWPLVAEHGAFFGFKPFDVRNESLARTSFDFEGNTSVCILNCNAADYSPLRVARARKDGIQTPAQPSVDKREGIEIAKASSWGLRQFFRILQPHSHSRPAHEATPSHPRAPSCVVSGRRIHLLEPGWHEISTYEYGGNMEDSILLYSVSVNGEYLLAWRCE